VFFALSLVAGLIFLGIKILSPYSYALLMLRYGPCGFIDKNGTLLIDLNKYHPGGFMSSPGHPNTNLNLNSASNYSNGTAALTFFNSEGGQTGVVDKNGKLRILAGKKILFSLSENLSMFQQPLPRSWHSIYGFADTNGDVVLKPKWFMAHNFSEGLAAVQVEQFCGWSYIDKKGNQVISRTFQAASDFSEGIATVGLNDKFGAIDRQGHEIVPAIFDWVYPASSGIIVAEQGSVFPPGEHYNDTVNIERFYFDKSGTKLFSKHVVVTKSNPDCRHRPLCSNGASGRYLHMRNDPSFFNGLAIVQEGAKYGYMNKEGKTVIPAIYDYAFPFSENMAAVYSFADDGKIAFIDHDGKQITPFKFGDALEFSEGLASVSEFHWGPFGFIDTKGNYALPPIYSFARNFKEGKALVGLRE